MSRAGADRYRDLVNTPAFLDALPDVAGLRCLDVPAFSVQYHPEAAAGPHDSAYLFDRFCDLMEAARAQA